MPQPCLLRDAVEMELRLVGRLARSPWFSRRKLGERIGVSGRAIDRWLSGERASPKGLLVESLRVLTPSQHAVAMSWISEETRANRLPLAFPGTGDPARDLALAACALLDALIRGDARAVDRRLARFESAALSYRHTLQQNAA